MPNLVGRSRQPAMASGIEKTCGRTLTISEPDHPDVDVIAFVFRPQSVDVQPELFTGAGWKRLLQQI
jgi:hypothetical protein